MSQQELIPKIFEFILLLFSLSFHEAAHAWMASRLGDQTARMLGRITLNPMKHIDPIGTILFPLVMLFGPFGGRFLVGWARPTPVNTRNFRKYVQGDVLTTLAGPASNFLISIVCVIVLIVLIKTMPEARGILRSLIFSGIGAGELNPVGALPPVMTLLYLGLWLNLLLAFFNLLPLPPLDGSHLIRHLLPTGMLQVYDRLGVISLILMFVFGGQIINLFVGPVLAFINRILLSA